jgi:hypothetical protein
MILTVFLILCGFAVTLAISAGTVVREQSRFHHLVLFFQSIRVPLAIVSALVALVSAVLVWTADYPLLTWIVVLLNSVIAVADVAVDRFNVPEGPLRNVLEFLTSNSRYFAIAGFVVLTAKSVYLLAPVLKLVL